MIEIPFLQGLLALLIVTGAAMVLFYGAVMVFAALVTFGYRVLGWLYSGLVHLAPTLPIWPRVGDRLIAAANKDFARLDRLAALLAWSRSTPEAQS